MDDSIKKLIDYDFESYIKVNPKWLKIIKQSANSNSADHKTVVILAELVYWSTPFVDRSSTDPEKLYLRNKIDSETGAIRINYKDLAKFISSTIDQVKKSIKKLKDLGLITTSTKRYLASSKKSDSTSIVNEHYIKLDVDKLLELESTVEVEYEQCHTAPQSSANQHHSLDNSIEDSVNINTIRATKEAVYPHRFEEAWSLYKSLCWDKRFGNKNVASKAWGRTIRRHGAGMIDEILKRTKTYLIDCKINKRYCKHASTFWGPDEIWNDEAWVKHDYDAVSAEEAFYYLENFSHLSGLLNGNMKVYFTGASRRTGATLAVMKRKLDLSLQWDGKKAYNKVSFRDEFLKVYPTLPEEMWSHSDVVINSNCLKEVKYDG